MMEIGSLLLSAVLMCTTVGTACHEGCMAGCARMAQDRACYVCEAEDCAIYGPHEHERIMPSEAAQAPLYRPDARPGYACASDTCLSGSCPSGTCLSGTCLSGTCFSDTCSSDTCSSDICPSGSCPSDSCPSGSGRSHHASHGRHHR